MFRLRICDIHILADDTKRLAIAAGSKYPVLHFLCLVCKPMLPQSALSDPHQVKNIAVLPDQRAVRLFRLRRRFPDKPAQTVGDKIREPCATESLMGLQTPHGKFPNLQVHTLKGIEQTGRIIILKSKNILELRAVFRIPASVNISLIPSSHSCSSPPQPCKIRPPFPSIRRRSSVSIWLILKNRLLSLLLVFFPVPDSFALRRFP